MWMHQKLDAHEGARMLLACTGWQLADCRDVLQRGRLQAGLHAAGEPAPQLRVQAVHQQLECFRRVMLIAY